MIKRFCAVGILSMALPVISNAEEHAPQYVVISFDGAHDNALWQRSRALSAETGAHFTYFLSCVYLLSPTTKHEYQAPGRAGGRSNVGFAPSKGDVADRLAQIWTARAEGHEIASHGCGHYDGKDWQKPDWLREFASFERILQDAYAINGIDGEPHGWKAFVAEEIAGFRAPYLSTSPSLQGALKQAGYSYNASSVSRDPEAADRRDAIASYALPMVPEGPKDRRIIAMDYNLFVRHSGGIERRSEAAQFSERTYQAFMAAYEGERAGKRRPLQLGFHFVLMNGGAYWDALERFAREVCGRTDTKCISYRELEALTGAEQGVGG